MVERGPYVREVLECGTVSSPFLKAQAFESSGKPTKFVSAYMFDLKGNITGSIIDKPF